MQNVIRVSSAAIRAAKAGFQISNVPMSIVSETTGLRTNPSKFKNSKTTIKATASCLVVPENPISAKEFISLLRHAKEQAEKISAIQSFIGYDRSLSYGTQEMVAMMKAKKDIQGRPDNVVSRETVRAEQNNRPSFMPQGSKGIEII